MASRYNILFFLDSDTSRSDLKLRCRVYWESNVCSLNVGYRVCKEQWVKATQRVKNNTFHGKKKIPASRINKAIQDMYTTLEEAFARFDLDGVVPTKEQFLSAIGKESKQGKPDLYQAWDDWVRIEGTKGEWTDATYKKMKSLRNHLVRFDSNLTFAKLTEEKAYQFIAYLQTPYAMQMTYDIDRGLKNTTIAKYLGFLRWFLKWASINGVYKGMLHQTLRPKFKGTARNLKQVIYLTWEELLSLYNYDFGAYATYAKTRDIFCLCCFTALRYSDAQKLSWSEVTEDAITLVMKKTSSRITIPLNNYAKEIMARYKVPGASHVMPRLSNEKANKYIKEACKMVGMDTPTKIVYFLGKERVEEEHPKYELVTTHCGRRTFVVNALSMGISPYIVKELGGWSDMRAMSPYMDVVDEAKKKVASAFNEWEGKNGGKN